MLVNDLSGELELHELKVDALSQSALTEVTKQYQLPVPELTDLPGHVSSWGLIPVADTLTTLAQKEDEEINDYAQKFAWVELPKQDSQGKGGSSSLGWRYDERLGFSREPGL